MTSDHGEGLYPPRLHHGGRLHNDLLHVPLVALGEPAIEEAPFGLVALKAWLLEAMGVRPRVPEIPGPLVAQDAAYLSRDDGARLSYTDTPGIRLVSQLAWPVKTIVGQAPGYLAVELYDMARDFPEADNLADHFCPDETEAPADRIPVGALRATAKPIAEAMGVLDESTAGQDADAPGVRMRGWALVPGRLVDVVAGVAGHWAPVTYPLDRPDVGTAYAGVRGARWSGFQAEVPLPEFGYPDGTAAVTVVFRYVDGDGRLQTWSLGGEVRLG